MTDEQKIVWAQIQNEKASPSPDKALLRKLAKRLTREDDRYASLKAQVNKRTGDGHHSRSCSYGRWNPEDVSPGSNDWK